MGREFIGDCPVSGEDSEFDEFQTELTIKYINQQCGKPLRGSMSKLPGKITNLEYFVISVVWDDSITEYPDEYIGKCMEAFERFDLPEEIREQYQVLFDLIDLPEKIHKLLKPE